MGWFENRLAEVQKEINNHFENYRLSEALKVLYSLIWNDFCSWYLEWIKPKQGQSVSTAAYKKTQFFFEKLLAMLHPYMPFVTEEIFNRLKERKDGEDLIVKQTEKTAAFQVKHYGRGELA